MSAQTFFPIPGYRPEPSLAIICPLGKIEITRRRTGEFLYSKTDCAEPGRIRVSHEEPQRDGEKVFDLFKWDVEHLAAQIEA